jgi:hypothetical protein
VPLPALPTLYSFPNGTAINGITVLGDGTLILSLPDRSELYALDPAQRNPRPVLAHRFPERSRILCVTELSRNRLAALVVPPEATEENPSPALWTVRLGVLQQQGVTATRVGDVLEGENFVSLLPLNRTTLLAANANGAVHRVNALTGAEVALFTDPSMVPSLGGIRYQAPYLYFVNTVQGLFSRIQVAPDTGDAVAPVEIIAQGPGLVGVADVALAPWEEHVAALVNYEQNSVMKVDANAKVTTVQTGWRAPTAAQFGRGDDDWNMLYVVTSGSPGIPGNVMAMKFPV